MVVVASWLRGCFSSKDTRKLVSVDGKMDEAKWKSIMDEMQRTGDGVRRSRSSRKTTLNVQPELQTYCVWKCHSACPLIKNFILSSHFFMFLLWTVLYFWNNDMLMIKHGFHRCYSAWLDDSCLIKQESFLQKHLSHYVLKKYFTVRTSTKCLKIYAFFKSLPYYGFHYIHTAKDFTVKKPQ